MIGFRSNGRVRAATLVMAIAALAVQAGCDSGDAGEGRSPVSSELPGPTAETDPFYAQPAFLPDRPGMILGSRPISYQPAGVLQPNLAWQLQYVTRDSAGRARAAVTTVIAPTVPSLYGHPVVVSFQHAYDSLGAQCTPSRTATGSTSNTTNMAETLEFLPPLQALGWTIVIPDYEGPDHAFGAGQLSGQATLDAIRAALNFEPLGLEPDTPAALWGYSGGAYATTWAAALQPGYAADVNLVGVVAGGTPVDLFDVIRRMEGTDSFNFLFTLVIGIAREYPELLPAGLLTEAGVDVVAAMKDSCEGNPPAGITLDGVRMSDYVAASDPYATAGFQSVMPKVSVLESTLVPTADLYLYHEIEDELVPLEGAEALVARWCEQGVPLSFYRSEAGTVTGATPTGVHTSGAAIGTPAAIAYIDSRFRAAPVSITPVGTVRCN